jgi:hypothetical protein
MLLLFNNSLPKIKKPLQLTELQRLNFYDVPWTGLEPACRFQHYPLKIACLPISPPGHSGKTANIRVFTAFMQ